MMHAIVHDYSFGLPEDLPGSLLQSGSQGYLPHEQFQTAQFWYNMIRWSQPNAKCFKIVDKQQPVTVW